MAATALLLCACRYDDSVAAVYEEPGRIATHICSLGPSTYCALLFRRYDESSSVIAKGYSPDMEIETVYTLPEGSLTYELTAGGFIIAFYELTTYSDGSVNYALKVIDEDNKVHSPYSKTVSEDNEIQTRFLAVYDDCVYYLTKSNLLGRCRVMKYSVKDKELTEYLGFEFTENELTNGSSCTFISEKNGYLTCGVVDGGKTTLKTYDLRTGGLVREKPLPFGAALVYMADHDYEAGTYAIYYLSAQGDERIASFAYTDNDMTDITTLGTDTYVSREEVRIHGDTVYYELQDTSKEKPYDQFTGVILNTATGEKEEYPGCMTIYIKADTTYGLFFDKNRGYEKMILKKLSEKGA